MKYLSDYTNDAQTQLFNDCGAFFAFSTKQFDKAKKDKIKYVSIGTGLICDKLHVKKLIDGLDAIQEAGIKQDIEDNGKKKIIHRELANHEAQITYDLEDTARALTGYGITDDELKAEFNKYMDYCRENDLF